MLETKLPQRIIVRVHVLLVASVYHGNVTYKKYKVISNPIVSIEFFGFHLQIPKRDVILPILEFILDSLRFPCHIRQVNSVTDLALNKAKRGQTSRGYLWGWC
jgi:hypothetical protein